MKAGDKFYQIVSPMKPMMLSGKADARETEDCIIIDGKLRKIGQWYPEEHTVEEIYLKENIVMDEDCHEYGIHDVYWDYEEALSHAAELNAEKKHERRSEATKKNLLKLIEEYRVKAQGYEKGSAAQAIRTAYADGLSRALYEIQKEQGRDAE